MWIYIKSVIIFYIILRASISICKVILNNNGRLEEIHSLNNKKEGLKPSVLLIACIPFLRLIVIILFYYICFCNEEEFKKFIKKEED